MIEAELQHNLIFQSIRNFLIDMGHQDLFDQYKLINSLSDKMKRKLSDALYEYLKKTFPKVPSVDDVTEVCKAAVSIFPLIKVDPSNIDGIVNIPIIFTFNFFSLDIIIPFCVWSIEFQDEFYNPKAHKGMLFHKLKNAKSTNASKNVPSNAETEESLKTFFKYCVVENDRAKLKNKLRGTIELRRKILKEKKEEFIDFLQFYFVDIDLVSLNLKFKIIVYLKCIL